MVDTLHLFDFLSGLSNLIVWSLLQAQALARFNIRLGAGRKGVFDKGCRWRSFAFKSFRNAFGTPVEAARLSSSFFVRSRSSSASFSSFIKRFYFSEDRK